jgi:hypothetical protein
MLENIVGGLEPGELFDGVPKRKEAGRDKDIY